MCGQIKLVRGGVWSNKTSKRGVWSNTTSKRGVWSNTTSKTPPLFIYWSDCTKPGEATTLYVMLNTNQSIMFYISAITYRVWSSSKFNVTFTSSQNWKYCRNFKMYDYLNKLFNLNSSYNLITFYTNISQ